jgi:hypothetical protein
MNTLDKINLVNKLIDEIIEESEEMVSDIRKCTDISDTTNYDSKSIYISLEYLRLFKKNNINERLPSYIEHYYKKYENR